MLDVLKNSFLIAGFVSVMMMVIEYVNVLTSGTMHNRLSRSRWSQYVIAAAMGALPGCLGPFAAVAMYSHGVISLGAVVAAMVATSGDEAFVMFAVVPRFALILTAALFALGVFTGILTDLLLGRFGRPDSPAFCELEVHDEFKGRYFPLGGILVQWRNCTAARGVMAIALTIMIVAVIGGWFEHGHLGEAPGIAPAVGEHAGGRDHPAALQEGGEHESGAQAGGDAGGYIPESEPSGDTHVNGESGPPGHEHGEVEPGRRHGGWNWIRVTLLVTSLVALAIVCTAHDHFIEEHLWEHIAKRHLPMIFLWTLGALIVIHLLMDRFSLDLATVAIRGRWFLLPAVCLIGLIPQSGPHLVFVALFAAGLIPPSILLANSIVQDGHGMLPMLAHSRRTFFIVKGINLIAGLLVGAAAMAAGF